MYCGCYSLSLLTEALLCFACVQRRAHMRRAPAMKAVCVTVTQRSTSKSKVSLTHKIPQSLSVPLSPPSHVSSLLTHSQILSVTNLSASNLEYVVNIKETGTRNRLCSSLSHIVRIFKEMVDYLTYVVKPCVLVLTSPRRTPWNSLCHSPSTRLHF